MNRFHFSDTIGKLAAAIVAAAAELEDIKREASANIPTKSGGSYSYKYATLPGILQAVRPILQKHDLAVLQNASEGGNASVDISTMIVHSSGEYLVLDALPMPMGNTAQETGSAITYGRRYQLLAALGLAADDDDDGATAAPRQPYQRREGAQSAHGVGEPISDKQKNMIRAISRALGKVPPVEMDNMTRGQASAYIDQLKEQEELAKASKNDKLMGDEEPF